MNEIKAGDWLMSGPYDPRRATLFQKGILTMGGNHTHDEIIAERNGILFAGNAHSPRFTCDPFAYTVQELDRKERVAAIFRWHRFASERAESLEYDRFQHGATACVKLLADLKIPYDTKAVLTHARNFLRGKLKFLRLPPMLGKHAEDRVFCTESCFAIYSALGIALNALAGFQSLPAPIHAEKLYRAGYLVLVQDFGLVERINSNKEKDNG
jgi:hypothetical protein